MATVVSLNIGQPIHTESGTRNPGHKEWDMVIILESHTHTSNHFGPPARRAARFDGNQGFPGTYSVTVR